ncbi:MAG: isopeptide-forming domain-containing fimbrial protein [Oscillospiraceae bacterium]|nr:isopeptide-forming domain-containing fimbrial protein [Oscillospiraceae bacterium]
MKKLKKLLSIVLAVAMVMSLAVSVTATSKTYSITIDNDVENYVYTAYQIFAGTLSEDETTLSNITWGSDVDTSNLTELYEKLGDITITVSGDTVYPFTDDPTTSGGGNDLTSASDVAAALSTYNTNSEIAEKFANVIYGYLKDNSGIEIPYVPADTEYYKEIDDPGYYLIVNTDVPSGTGIAYSALLLEVVGQAEADPKSAVPELDKTVDDVNDSDSTDKSTGDTADYDIGDSVPFTLTATISDDGYSKYSEYTLVFHDTVSAGLIVDLDSIKVWVDDTQVNTSDYTVSTLTDAYVITDNATADNFTDYYVEDAGSQTGYSQATGTYDSSTTYYELGHTFTVTISDTKTLTDTNSDNLVVNVGDTIKVTYSATLNTNATFTEYNNAYLEYSDNPLTTSSTGTTPEEQTTVFTYTLNVTKVDDSDPAEALNGAKFKLYKLVDITEFASGVKYYTYDSGTFTEVADTSSGVQSGTDYYILVDNEEKEGEGNDKNEFSWDGLDAGKYILEESETPDGYNTMEDLKFMITAEHEYDNGTAKLTEFKVTDWDGNTLTAADMTATSITGVVSSKIVNKSGSNLPETGGIGVTIFYVVGGILILAAAGVIVINRKKIKK